MTPEQMLADWLRKAQFVVGLPEGEPWPAWSVGECLAVACILARFDVHEAMGYTYEQAVERLRYDVGMSYDQMAETFADMREQAWDAARSPWKATVDAQASQIVTLAATALASCRTEPGAWLYLINDLHDGARRNDLTLDAAIQVIASFAIHAAQAGG